MDEGEINSNGTDPWAQAKQAVRYLGDLSATFTSCVRALLNNEAVNQRDGKNSISLVCQGLSRQILNSPSVVSHLYFAALTYHPKEVESREKFKPEELLNIFGLREMAALLTVLYFYRRVVKRADPADWNALSSQMQLYVDVAIPLGAAIPSIGPIRALLVASSRFLAWGAILSKDPKGFKKYKVTTKIAKTTYDLKLEQETWATTYPHVAATMFQAFGFGVEFSNAFYRGITHPKVDELTDEEKRFRVAQLWLDSLVRDGTVPKETIGDEYCLSESQVDTFVERVTILSEKGSEHNWLMKTRKDLNADTAPKLIFDYNRAMPHKPGDQGDAGQAEEIDDEVTETSPPA